MKLKITGFLFFTGTIDFYLFTVSVDIEFCATKNVAIRILEIVQSIVSMDETLDRFFFF